MTGQGIGSIVVERVSKKYRKGSLRARNLVEEVPRTIRGWLSGNHRDSLERDEFWALREVSFTVAPGNALGVIGPNGAGKSTMLKLLTRISRPTDGRISVQGRVGALIELGAGFHPELTGRENIYLYGSILGMRRKEIEAKFERIVEFSGLGDFVDTPIKRYSSGMNVRLGFAVAAHVEPSVLLVDEVLAVGDLAFQAKCLEKIRGLREDGTTIVYVSHQLQTVERLCERVILLVDGKICHDGDAVEAIDRYRLRAERRKSMSPRVGTGEVEICEVELLGDDGAPRTSFQTGELCTVRIRYAVRHAVSNPVFAVSIHTVDGVLCTAVASDLDGEAVGVVEGKGVADLRLDLNLLPNVYLVSASILKEGGLVPYDRREQVLRFQIAGARRARGVCFLPHSWDWTRET